jgi:hypothetical protein
VFDSHGEVIAVNAAYIEGFSRGTIGIGAANPLSVTSASLAA